MAPINIKQFTWVPESKTLVTEASYFTLPNLQTMVTEGFEVMNFDTGNKRTFTYVDTDHDGCRAHDGEEVHGWNFKSSDGIKVLIIND